METSTSLGSSTDGADSETWQYNWTLGYGSGNSTESITYPSSLSSTLSTAQLTLDPANNVIATTNALGDVATSAYNDAAANVMPELLWSYPGESSNGPTDPPSGSWTYAYNSYGQMIQATDPLGNSTYYVYYLTTRYIDSPTTQLCEIIPSTVATEFGTGSCTGQSNTGPGSPTTGATTFTYDDFGNLASTTVDQGDTSSGADPQTTTYSHNIMGDMLWTIPPAGQSGVQSSANPYATVSTYSPLNLLTSVTPPGQGATTFNYDAASNLVGTAGPASTTSTVYDGDNRPCYELVAGPGSGSGLTCSSAPQAGSTSTSYVPGGANVESTTDALGSTTSYYYGDLAYPNSPTEVVDPAGSETQYSAYNDYGNVCVQGDVPINAEGTTSQCDDVLGDSASSYNALGNELTSVDQLGNATTNSYGDSAYPTLLTSSTNALGNTISYSYDADGRLLGTTNPDGSSIDLAYDPDGRTCSESTTGTSYPCGTGIGVSGVTTFAYNGANERTSMDSYSPGAAVTSYTYQGGELAGLTDSNAKSVSYLYNYAGQVQCVAYPVATGSTCGTLSSPATASTSNTIVSDGYDLAGRLSTVTDWLGNKTTYSYGDANDPGAVTTITYPTSTGLSASYTYDSNGNVAGLAAGSLINDSWTYNPDEQVATTTINGTGSGTVSYNANRQITAATNLAGSSSNDAYTVAANGEITTDAPPSGPVTNFTYNAGDELCNESTTLIACGTAPSSGTNYQFTANGERSVATPYANGTAEPATYYAWNALGELCNIAANATTCGTQPTSGTNYIYNGDGLRVTASTATATTDYAWDVVSGGSLPLDINDATTAAGATTNTSYLYGPLLFGGTAPVEQITTTPTGSSASFLVSNPTGVQEVVGSTGTTEELAVYSLYGVPTITQGSDVTPFGFQGSYTDPTGLIYLVNRYYDPATDQFLSVDPDVAATGQPYVFTNDDPLNDEDPLGTDIEGAPEWGYFGGPNAGTTPTPDGGIPESQVLSSEASEIDVESLRGSAKVEAHNMEYSKDGRLSRPYGSSPLTMREIIKSPPEVDEEDPGALKWVVKGTLNGTPGTYELVINPSTETIYHFVFVGGK